MPGPAILVEHLSKRHYIGSQPRYRTLRETLVETATSPLRMFRGVGRRDEIWALDDVSFEVPKGAVVGIVGSNGAGKSTLLKVLAGITPPTKGRATIRGRIASLLEVGTGFHPELTGAENIYLNGAILGMHRHEIQRAFAAIVAFAEVEKFLHTPVKHYSSGMYVRLAFAVAAHLEPEILLVDEVIAVGDAAFQNKCLGKMEAASRSGRTVLFVSHNMAAVQRICERALWISAGRLQEYGEARSVVGSYLRAVQTGAQAFERRGDTGLVVERVVLRNSRGEPAQVFAPGERLTIDIDLRAERSFERPQLHVAVSSQYGALLAARMDMDDHRPSRLEGTGRVTCTFDLPILAPQTYAVALQVRASDGMTDLFRTQQVGFFQILAPLADYGFQGEAAELHADSTSPLFVPYEWSFPDGKRVRVDPATHLASKHAAP